MKDVVKGVLIKVISLIVIVALIIGAIFGFIQYKKGNFLKNFSNRTESSIEVIKEKLETTAELNTAEYLCTQVLTESDTKTFKGFNIPFTTSSYVIQYDGTVKAGIKDLTKADVSESDGTIVVTLPAVEITSVELDKDSFELLDESEGLFNKLDFEDFNNAQSELEDNMKSKAEEKGVLDMAKNNAETVLKGLLGSTDSEIQIEWQE